MGPVVVDNKYTIDKKPVVSWWKCGDPCKKITELSSKLTDITVVETKNLTQEFCDFCLTNKNHLYLHVTINGMGRTVFEPNIPTVKEMFGMLQYLINNGFRQQQILVIVNPILPNHNGLKALQLLLRVFTEFRQLRLRYIRFQVLRYTKTPDGKYTLGNLNIAKRPGVKQVVGYLTSEQTFWNDYYQLIKDYEAIIHIDKDEPIIGIRELMAFGMNNNWRGEKIIAYEKGNRFKPIVKVISNKFETRCGNRCLLCPHKF